MAIENKKDISIMNEDVPKGELDFLMEAVFNTILSNKNRSLRFFVIYEEGDTVVDIPENLLQRLQFLDRLINYFEKTEEYEKCQELLIFKNLAKRHWGLK